MILKGTEKSFTQLFLFKKPGQMNMMYPRFEELVSKGGYKKIRYKIQMNAIFLQKPQFCDIDT